jgi:hypothetical protein
MSEYQNFPRVVTGSYLDREPGRTVQFPAPRVASGGPQKVDVPIPKFDAILANPLYVRSQHQDDLDPGYRSKLFLSANKAGVTASAKTDLFAFFIYHSLIFMKPGSRLGFVTSSSWLTSDFAATLQKTLMNKVQLIAVITSSAESFFTQVDINTVILIAEMKDGEGPEYRTPIPFVNLKKNISELINTKSTYWGGVQSFVGEIELVSVSTENDRYSIKLVDPELELAALDNAPNKPRNWSKYLRAPMSYYNIFGEI